MELLLCKNRNTLEQSNSEINVLLIRHVKLVESYVASIKKIHITDEIIFYLLRHIRVFDKLGIWVSSTHYVYQVLFHLIIFFAFDMEI